MPVCVLSPSDNRISFDMYRSWANFNSVAEQSGALLAVVLTCQVFERFHSYECVSIDIPEVILTVRRMQRTTDTSMQESS